MRPKRTSVSAMQRLLDGGSGVVMPVESAQSQRETPLHLDRLAVDTERVIVGERIGEQAGEQAERVVVVVDRDPGDRGLAGEAGDEAGESGRLAEAGRRRDQDQALRRGRGRHACLERASLDKTGARPWRLDLGEGEGRGGHDGVGARALLCASPCCRIRIFPTRPGAHYHRGP